MTNLSPHAVVLDLGCGSGVFSIMASAMARKVIAIDGSREIINLAREDALRRRVTNIQFITGRLENFTDLVPEQVDLILCSSVLEYIADPDSFLQSCANVLKPSGMLLVSVPNGDSLYRICERIIFKNLKRPRYYAYVKTVEKKSKTSSRLDSAGFHIRNIRHFGPVPFLSWLFRLLNIEHKSDTLTLFVAKKNGS